MCQKGRHKSFFDRLVVLESELALDSGIKSVFVGLRLEMKGLGNQCVALRLWTCEFYRQVLFNL